jgi:hypothetical protein
MNAPSFALPTFVFFVLIRFLSISEFVAFNERMSWSLGSALSRSRMHLAISVSVNGGAHSPAAQGWNWIIVSVKPGKAPSEHQDDETTQRR